MKNPPEVCPACGDGLRQPSSESSRFFDCGVGYLTQNAEGTGDWFRLEHRECCNAFDVAVKLREENEKLKREIDTLNELMGTV